MVFDYSLREVEDGAGVRWTPLHFNAEAPTEPAGETLPYNMLLKRFRRGRRPRRPVIKLLSIKPILFSLLFYLLSRRKAFCYALFTEPKSSIFSFTVSQIACAPGARSFLGSKPLPCKSLPSSIYLRVASWNES